VNEGAEEGVLALVEGPDDEMERSRTVDAGYTAIGAGDPGAVLAVGMRV
jgi:hypothetical protein